MLKNYRSDIDGLRAIAVILVVLYHVKMPFINGGFVGVDVFFVISGYLITSIIKDDIANGSFSFSNFYKRRIKRIIPALFVVCMASFIAGLFLLGNGDLISLSRSILASSLSLSNIYFLHVSEGYFAPSTDELPLLHTWSLSVEEQFYFIWPLCLLLLSKKLSNKAISRILLVAAIMSLSYSVYLTGSDKASAYYVIASRSVGMLMGAFLAVSGIKAHRNNTKIAYAGLAVIVMSSIAISADMSFPGYLSFIPSFGAALYIYASDNSRKNILTFRPVVFIGLISYSLYLWHWPLSAFANYYGVLDQYKFKIAIVFISILLSYASLKFIESPIRKSKLTFKSSLSFIMIPFVMVSFLAWVATEKTKGFPDRFKRSAYSEALKVTNFANLDHGWCHVSKDNENGITFTASMAKCHIGDKNGKIKALFIGDSTAGHYGPFIDRLAKNAGVDVLQMSTSSCFPTFDPRGTGENPDVCKNFRRIIRQEIESKNYNYIIVSSYWQRDNNAISYKPGRNNFAEIFSYYSNNAKHVIVLGQPPEFRVNPGACYVRGAMGNSKCDLSANFGPLMVFKASNKVVSDITKKFGNVSFVDPSSYVCNSARCSPFLDGLPLYHDQTHLSEHGSDLLGRLYLRDNDNPL